MLSLMEAIVVGLVQGMAEWLPVSSEGPVSMVLINASGWSPDEAISLSVGLHGGIAAAAIYLRTKIIAILPEVHHTSKLPGSLYGGKQRSPD